MAGIPAAREPQKSTWREQWVIDKLSLIDRLREEVAMSQHDAQVLIVGSILGAIAAELWPSKHRDRQRFVQLLVAYADPALGTKTISVPLLKDYLNAKGWTAEAGLLAKHWGESSESEFMLGIEVDVDEHELIALCPNVPNAFVRQFSYANLLYDEIQLGSLHANAKSHASQKIPSSEVGYARIPDRQKWMIHFGVDWLRALVISAEELSRAARVDKGFTDWWLP